MLCVIWGFLPLGSIYHELKLDQFLINRQRIRSQGTSKNISPVITIGAIGPARLTKYI